MQPVKVSSVRLAAYLKADHQWKRQHRIAFARLMLKFAWAKEDQVDVAFYRAVLRANEFDADDKQWRSIRAQRDEEARAFNEAIERALP